jgi:hypothetical protein
MTSTGLRVFYALCDCGNTIVACRDDYQPGSDTSMTPANRSAV